jgi:hypothetical protein
MMMEKSWDGKQNSEEGIFQWRGKGRLSEVTQSLRCIGQATGHLRARRQCANQRDYNK